MEGTLMGDGRCCEEADCLRQAHSGGRYCSGHAKQIERDGKTSGPIRERLSIRERCLEKAIEVVNYDDDDNEEGYERAWDALEHALKDWHQTLMRSRGGKARWRNVSPEERSAVLRKAGQASGAARRQQAIACSGKGTARARIRPRKRRVREGSSS
jgi:predicted Fe-S protein YdhL (DUF1289 family)